MKLTLKIDSKNKYRNELWVGDRLAVHGNDGLENVEIVTHGKRTAAVLTLTGVNIIVKDSECPEAYRYHEIMERFGNRSKLSELGLICDMLKISPTACDGCVYRPDRDSVKYMDEIKLTQKMVLEKEQHKSKRGPKGVVANRSPGGKGT